MKWIELMAALFGLDFFLKEKIEEQNAEGFPRDLEGTGGKIKIYKNHNDGFCFGMMKKNRGLVNTMPLVFSSAAAGIFAWLLTRKSTFAHKLGFAFIVSGAASNLLDRIKRGYVVDYFSFQFGVFKKVVFNIGDLCIFLGSAIIIISDLFRKE